MEYISTRNNSDHFSFKNVFLKGLADDGGLFVPKSIKPFSKDELNKLTSLNYNELAAEIIFPFIGDFMTKEELISTVSKSCLLYTSPSPRDREKSRMPSSA